MQLLVQVVKHTPLWVFILLAYLVWQGAQSLRPRIMPLWRLLIVPLVFIAMGVSRIVLGHEPGHWPLLSWLIAAALLAPLASVTGPRRIMVDRQTGMVTRPGTPATLIRNVSVFVLQYGVAVAGSLQLHGQETVAIIGHAVSGATAGYFAGWAVALLRRYRSAV